MKKWICILLSFSLVLGLYACTKGTAEDLTESLKPQKIEKITDFTNGNQQLTQFGIDLFRTSHKQDENTLISPLSVLYALAMTANGAEAETLAQMESVFGLDIETLNLWLSSYQDVLSKELKLANSIWFRDSGDFTVNQAFLQANTDYYKADIFKAPFDSETCREINKWVEKNTDGMIPSILEEIPADAVMYLVNALAFDAQWAEPYREYQMREGTFTTQRGYVRDVEMMYSEEGLYLEDEDATGFLKYYKGERYAFAALLPEVGMTVKEYLDTLTGERLQELMSHPYEATVRTCMPKFRVEYDVEMSEILQDMGMTDAFNGDLADFDGIGHSDAGNLFISRVLHKTFLEVDDKGTKASAATAVEILPESAAPEPDFYTVYLDRPFVYLLIDTKANLPLFIGTMMDPTGEEVMPITEEPLSGPPELFVSCGDCDCHMAVLSGNYWWEGPAVNGQTGAVIACGSHPLDGTHTKDFTTVTGDWLTLAFPVWPDEITVRRWPGTEIGNTDHWGEEMTLDGKYLAVEDGDWVYQIDATWNRDTWKGSAEYHLYISK